MSRSENRKKGSRYEQAAFDYLIRSGLSKIMTNYYCRYGEIDGIFNDDGVIVFVEVKYRSDDVCGDAALAVDRTKQKKISRCALSFIRQNRLSLDRGYRFDVVAIDDGKIRWIKNAFEFMGNIG